MAKKRVHELAKELNIKSTDVIEVLKSTPYAVTNVQSGLEDAAQDLVRRHYAPKENEKPENSAGKGKSARAESSRMMTFTGGKATKQKNDHPDQPDMLKTDKSADLSSSAAKTNGDNRTEQGQRKKGTNVNMKENNGDNSKTQQKKSNITSIYNAQYSNSNGSRRSAGNRNGRNRKNEPKQEPRGIIRPRPVGERAMRPISERTANNRDDFAPEEVKQTAPAAEQVRPQEEPKVDVTANANETTVNTKPTETVSEPTRPREETLSGGSRILGNIFTDSKNAGQNTSEKHDGAATGTANAERGRGERKDRRDGSRGDGERRDRRDGNRGDGSRSDNRERNGSRNGSRNAGDRPAGNDRGDRMERGERTDRGNRSYGDRQNRGENGNRTDRRDNRAGSQGDRNASRGTRGGSFERNSGERGSTRNGERTNNYNGDRTERGNRGDRNDRGNFGGDRGYNKDERNERGGSNGDRRNNRQSGGRDRFDRNGGASAAEEVRGKESREQRSGNDWKNNNNRRNKDHDKLGSKRQENYVNLERHGGKKKPAPVVQAPKEEEDTIKTITLPEKMTIRDLADKMKLQPSVIVKKLFLKGEMVTVNSEISFEEAEEIALEFNFICEAEEKVDVIAELLKEDEEDEENLIPRSPVVCVMGHVDHGKTSLLDAIRSTRITDREAGGITQHIGASVVSINNQNITFLDTPGHEAFTAMRMRGANSTDIAVLVIAADDGVMPQTVEAINHARAAGVEIIVAINKIDKPGANPEKVKQELTEYELVPEDWGGSTVFCEVSAKTKQGIDNLLEMILLTAEVLELRANPNRNARGLVIEAQLDRGRGAVATMLVQKGTLHVGDPVACGSCYGKVRAMIDDQGRRVKEATPSMPVEILGLNNVPNAGEVFVVTDSEKEAKEFADTYIAEEKNRLIEETRAKMSLDDLFSQIQSGNMKELDIIVKADVQGSVEAVRTSLEKLSNEEVVVKVIHGGVGAINESDVILASASNAIIIGFNVRPDPIAKVTADREMVDIRLYKVIYNAIEDVEAAMKGMLDPVFEEKILGHAEIRQIFKASGVGNIAGSYVLDGTIERGCKVRISREGNQIFEGELASLKRFKDDVKEVRTGFECGLVFTGFNDIQELDIVEAYKMVEVPR